MDTREYFLIKTLAEFPLIDSCGFTLDGGHAHLNHYLPAFLNHPAQKHYYLHDDNAIEDSHRAA
ncbi:hypothetical protein [Methanoregula sp.]|jgi:hypothetical protein|uniref:hypothetical protein n=1 Tax=Methanoregula sp. TaxID=2052170 RepID=UPI00356760CA